jgi:hypothetical protein
MSLAERIGLPAQFQATLLVVALLFVLAPYFSGLTIGGVQLPRLNSRRRRVLKISSPALLVAMVMLVIPLEALSPPPSHLEIVAADVTDNGEIDLAVSNSGTAGALLTRIEIEVIALRSTIVRPVLFPTASYRVEMTTLTPGTRHYRLIRHLIPPKTIERIVIVPETNRAMRVRVSLHASGDTVLSREFELWALRR